MHKAWLHTIVLVGLGIIAARFVHKLIPSLPGGATVTPTTAG